VFRKIKKVLKNYSLALRSDGSKPPKKPQVVFVYGGIGVGKETQSKKLAEKHGFTLLNCYEFAQEETNSQSKDCEPIVEILK
jgi:2-phosphoglycerate kinase